MNRLFKRTNFAKYFLLDKLWDFVFDPQDKGVEEKWYVNFPAVSERIPVPSCWNMDLGKFLYEGTAWYRTDFETTEDSIYLKFEGVANECDVYIDGKHIGYHYGPFVEFGFLAENIGKGAHELVVRVNNTINYEDTTPHPATDWYNYGGINRSVEVREIGEVWISDSRIDYSLDVDNKSAVLDITAEICTKLPVCEDFEVYVNDELVYSKKAEINGKEKICAKGIELKDINLWDIYKPNLYYIRIKYGNEDIIDRVGFRNIKTCGKDILLNGKKIILTGVCRHEEHADWGFAMPFTLIKRDIDIIRDLNCNSVRGSHYPNSKMTLDYLDEMGMLFWEEIPVWGYRKSSPFDRSAPLDNEKFITRLLSMHHEMVKRDLNHPCIIMWGLHNEIATNQQNVYDMSVRMVQTIKALDTSRLITYATNQNAPDMEPDICFELVDVISHNYYTGWYTSTKDEDFAEFIKRSRAYAESIGCGDKPMTVSEFGAGAVKGATSFEALRWTENYQAALLEDAIEQYYGTGEVCGTFIWQFCDMRTGYITQLSRPRSFNNKGIVDEYRRPKFAYETVKRLYKKYNPDSDNVTKTNLY